MMLSVQNIQPLIYKEVPNSTYQPSVKKQERDINGNMIGSGLSTDLKSNKYNSKRGGDSLDSKTLLIILNSVLNTQHKRLPSPAACDNQRDSDPKVDYDHVSNKQSQGSVSTPVKKR